jgi:Glycosyltransferase family 87
LRQAASVLLGSWRVWLVVVAATGAIIGVGFAILIAPDAWALDIERYLKASRDLAAGRFGTDRAYLYSPLAALFTLPLTLVPIAVATLAWLIAKLGVLELAVRREVFGLPLIDGLLIGVAVLFFLPTSYDLLLGNVTVFVVAAVALVAWRTDRITSGIALGLILATAPKPQLIPILIWMLAFRRRALVGALATAALATLIAVLFVGIGPYLAWIDVLRTPLYFESHMEGNLNPDAVVPALALPIEALTLAGFLIALRRGETGGLVAATATGLLIAPYTLAYGAMMLLLAVRPVVRASPRTGLVLGLVGSAGVVLALPVYALAWLIAGAGLQFDASTGEAAR